MLTQRGQPGPLILQGKASPRLEWIRWHQQFEQYAQATQFYQQSLEEQVRIFLNVIGPEAREIFEQFALSESEKRDFNVVRHEFVLHFDQKRNVVLERFHFNRLHQGYYLTFEEFLDKLNTQSKLCDFREMRNDMIRDRIVAGIQQRSTQQRLLREPGLTLQVAVDICRSREHQAPAGPRGPPPHLLAQRRALRYARSVREAQQLFDKYRRGHPYDPEQFKMKAIIDITDTKCKSDEDVDVTLIKTEVKEEKCTSALPGPADTKPECDRTETPPAAVQVKQEPPDGDDEVSLCSDIHSLVSEFGLPQ